MSSAVEGKAEDMIELLSLPPIAGESRVDIVSASLLASE
jgi:hypothetical protein